MSEAYWYKVRLQQGFDIDKPMTLQERIFWSSVRKRRFACEKTDDPYEAIQKAYPFDKQYFLGKRWASLDTGNREELLEHVWLNKGDGLLLGYDWWLPYFNEVGFTSNCRKQPTEPLTLYRGATEGLKVGMSWTDNFEVAKIFASQGYIFSDKRVYKAVVNPECILAIYKGTAATIDKPSESFHVFDYVINHQKLDIELIEEVKL